MFLLSSRFQWALTRPAPPERNIIMSILDTTPASTFDLAPESPSAPDYFTAGREVWVPSRNSRARILAIPSEGRANGGVYTQFGDVDDAIPLPMPGETLIGGAFFVGWANPVDDNDLTGLTTGGMILSRVVKSGATEWDARRIVDATDTAAPDVTTILSLLCAEHSDRERATEHARQEGRRQAEDAAQRRLDALVTDAHEWANEHDLCETFDRFCRKHDLPEREREYEVTAHLTISVPVVLTVTSTNDVQDTFNDTYDEDDIWRMIRNQEIDPSSVTAYDLEFRDYEQTN